MILSWMCIIREQAQGWGLGSSEVSVLILKTETLLVGVPLGVWEDVKVQVPFI